MRFSILSSAVAALAVFNTAAAQITPAQVVENIKSLTVKSAALQAPAQSITLLNAPLIVIGQGPFPRLILGFTDIVITATRAIGQMQGMAAVPAGSPSDLIFDAFREFVRVHQVLLNILIGKAGFLTRVPLVGPPVAAVLRRIEAVVDTVAFGLIDNVQSRAQDLRAEAGKLTGTITIAIDNFDGIALA